MALSRSSRWNVMAKRWDSSRTCLIRYSDAEPDGRTIGVSSQGTNTSSSDLARPHTGISKPNSASCWMAAVSWGLPPSTTSKSGREPKRLSAIRSGLYRRPSTSDIDTKSFASSSSAWILKRRYCDLSGFPLVNTTMDATVKLPCNVEISKHSIRKGGASRASADSSCKSAWLLRSSE